MSLTDIMSSLDLDIFPQIGLLIFFGAFVAVVVHTLRRPRAEVRALAELPIADEQTTSNDGSPA
jgi:cbb3-type cytochrome oxidase subunit 3